MPSTETKKAIQSLCILQTVLHKYMTKKFLRKKYENSSPSFNNGTKPNNKKKPNKVTEIA